MINCNRLWKSKNRCAVHFVWLFHALVSQWKVKGRKKQGETNKLSERSVELFSKLGKNMTAASLKSRACFWSEKSQKSTFPSISTQNLQKGPNLSVPGFVPPTFPELARSVAGGPNSCMTVTIYFRKTNDQTMGEWERQGLIWWECCCPSMLHKYVPTHHLPVNYAVLGVNICKWSIKCPEIENSPASSILSTFHCFAKHRQVQMLL